MAHKINFLSIGVNMEEKPNQKEKPTVVIGMTQ